MAKVVPEPVSYTTPEEVQKEILAAGGVDESQIVMTYEIDSTDLNNYKRVQDYKPGKTNPFSSYVTEETQGQNTTNNNSSTGGTSSSANSGTSSGQTTNNNTSSSGGKYFQDKGTK